MLDIYADGSSGKNAESSKRSAGVVALPKGEKDMSKTLVECCWPLDEIQMKDIFDSLNVPLENGGSELAAIFIAASIAAEIAKIARFPWNTEIITIYSDHKPSIDVIRTEQTAQTSFHDTYKKVSEMMKNSNSTIEHVYAHRGNPGNEKADEMANRGRGLPGATYRLKHFVWQWTDTVNSYQGFIENKTIFRSVYRHCLKRWYKNKTNCTNITEIN